MQTEPAKALGNWPNTGDIRFEKVGGAYVTVFRIRPKVLCSVHPC